MLRGVGLSDLPAPADLATLSRPTLILAWDTDPRHPVSTAERLHAFIPNSTLQIARTVDEVNSWTQRTAEFFNGSPPAGYADAVSSSNGGRYGSAPSKWVPP